MAAPTFEVFKKLAAQGNLIPVFEEIHFDWETPVSAFRKIDDGKFSFLLESVEGGEKWGRYSFLGSGPSYIYRSKGSLFEILKNGAILHRGEAQDPLRPLEDFLKSYHPAVVESLPRFFGGAVGYVNYEAVKSFDKIPERLPKEIDFYTCQFMVTDTLLVFDNIKQRMTVIVHVFLDEHPSLRQAYHEARIKIEKIIHRLTLPQPPMPAKPPSPLSPPRSGLSQEDFLKMVERAKKYIQAGDIIQVVLSQRFSTEIHSDPFEIYRALRSVNPSPYLFFLRMDDVTLLGSSPEVMVRLEGKEISLRPLAGTRRRGKTREEDLALEKELLADEKERAEHIMLVDLGRNDVGRIAEIGSVVVTELMGVERYSHVMHIVSHIRGSLAQDKNGFDVFRSAFPAGTVSGAPKIRAMEIIEELEPVRRGPYAGAVGYFSFSGNMDTCITIRSVWIKDGKAHVQAGAGIVAGSDPMKEYEETLNKAQAIIKAIELAERGLSVR